MNLRDLKYLVAVADFCHFGKAAEACFVTQPALSMQIKKLEETLGVQLIERTNKSVMLTEAGKSITQYARTILLNVSHMKEMARTMQDPFAGNLHIGVIPTLAPYLLPHILPELSALFPKLTVYLVEDTTDNLVKKLIKGSLDVALLALPIDDENLVTTPLFEEDFYLLVSSQHPLSKAKKVHITDLDEQTLLLLKDGHCLRNQALQVCQNTHIINTTNFQATSLETLKQMVAFNSGVTLMPKLTCREEEGICYIPFVSPSPKRTIGLIHRHSSPKKLLLEKIGEIVKTCLKQKKIVKVLEV